MPSWLELLLATKFFTTCTNHLLASRNECNLFCTNCKAPPYECVIIEDILDISDVQTYIINSARVVFLNERPQQCGSRVSICRGPSSPAHNCEIYGRTLLDAFFFCSLGCNLMGIKEDVSMQSIFENGPLCGGKDDVTSTNNVGSSTPTDKDSCNDNNEEELALKRIAHHRRKGIPQRAPFF
ncbi:hypothetical protein BS78_05G087200 [Paspalum vaginatum]|nr:hypothetical protein BS78_05G087200 [Paspalum vaginatum]